MLQNESKHQASTARRRARAERTKKMAEKPNDRGNLSKQDWLQAALEVLNQRGISAVKILPLSKKLGVTRGSFYWHFEDRDELLREMLQYWEIELTDSVIKHARNLGAPPRERLADVLTNVILNRRSLYDTAIAAWGMFDEHAATCYARVLRKRLRFLSSMLSEAGVDKEQADFRARLILGFALSSGPGRGRTTRADLLKDIERCCDMALA